MSDWKEIRNINGKLVYFNVRTNETRTTPPEGMISKEDELKMLLQHHSY